jgi:anti-sigma B factor antagonist
MSIETRKVDEVTILGVHGKITFSEGSGELSDKVSELLTAGEKKILLNVKGVKQVDSQGIAELLKAHISITKQGGQIKLTGLSTRLHELLTVTKLILVFDIQENEQAALESFL